MRYALALVSLAFAVPASAMTQDEVLQADLLPGWRMEGGHHMAGLSLALAPGWKTYWRSPGEAGIPPEFDWSGSQNVKSVRIHWPSPVVFHTNGMQTVGYKGGVVLPLEVVPEVPGQPVVLRARVDMGVCKDICMPAQVTVSADLPAPGAEQGDIRAALKARPATGGQAGVGRVACVVEPIADGLRLTATVEIAARGGDEAVVFEPADRSIWVAEAVTSRQAGVLTSVTELVAATGAPFALDRSGLRLTVLGGARAVEIEGCPAP
jgi:DsbC/DsbD-like thiol-disulfide interchange protein